MANHRHLEVRAADLCCLKYFKILGPLLKRLYGEATQRDRTGKMHVHFDVLKGIPVDVTVTAGSGSETAQLRATLKPNRLYVIDRGYADNQLF